MKRDDFKSVPFNSECILVSHLLLHASSSRVLLKSTTGCSSSHVLLVSTNDIPSQYYIINKEEEKD